MDSTIIQQGVFTADGSAKILTLRSDIDWMSVINYTKIAANAASTGYRFYWQRGLSDGDGFEEQSTGAATEIDLKVLGAAGGGFTLIDSSDFTLPASVALTGITNASPPVITSAGHGLSIGDIVRFTSLDNQPQIGGIDFSVTAVAATFTIGNINLSNSTASTDGNWRKVPYESLYYPRSRFITYISSSATTGRAKIYMSVTHTFIVGEKVRLQLPGSTWNNFSQLNNRIATVVAVNEARAGTDPTNGGTANNIVVDIDVSGLGSWLTFGAASNQGYPADGEVPFTPAQVVPLGEDTAQALTSGTDMLADQTYNTGYLGMNLGAGADAPAGQANDVIYWTAGKSFSNLAE